MKGRGKVTCFSEGATGSLREEQSKGKELWRFLLDFDEFYSPLALP